MYSFAHGSTNDHHDKSFLLVPDFDTLKKRIFKTLVISGLQNLRHLFRVTQPKMMYFCGMFVRKKKEPFR